MPSRTDSTARAFSANRPFIGLRAYVVLCIIAEGPTFGAEITAEYEMRMREVMSADCIYKIMKGLLRAKLVRYASTGKDLSYHYGEWKKGARYYLLTEEGKLLIDQIKMATAIMTGDCASDDSKDDDDDGEGWKKAA